MPLKGMLRENKFWFCIGLFLVIYMVHYKVSFVGDDIWFAAVQKTPYFEWITARYNQWSGRIFAETTLYFLMNNKVWLWRLINPFLFMLLAFCIARIIKKNVNFREFVIALLTLGFFSQPVLSSALFWITGSINYLWPISLGLFAMIPYADRFFKRELPFTKKRFLLVGLSGILATLGNEQMALLMAIFSLLSHACSFLRREKQDAKLLILTSIILLGTSALLLAPGNQARWVAEAKQWYPGFETMPLQQHLHVGIMWMFEKMFGMMRNLIFALSFVTLFASSKNLNISNSWYFKLVGLFLCLTFFSTLVLGPHVDFLYNFNSIKTYSLAMEVSNVTQINKQFLLALLPYVFWTVYSLLLCYLIIKNGKHKIFLALCLIATVLALVVIFFSPTIFASGHRVLAVSSVLLSIVIMYTILRNNLLDGYFELILFAGLPLANFLLFFSKWFFKGYSVMF